MWRLVASQLRISIIVLAAWHLVGCGDKSASGTYIAEFTNAAWLLQLVETPDRHLTGQLETVTDVDGKIETASYAVSGAVEGNNIAVSLNAPVILSQPISASGTFTSSEITLTGMLGSREPVTHVFKRGAVEKFHSLVQAINAQAATIQAAKATKAANEKAAKERKEFVAGVEYLLQRMGHFGDAVDAATPKLTAASKRYRDITSKMGEYLDRERALAGNRNAGLARSQLVVTMNQGPIATNQLHIDVQQIQIDYNNNAVPLMELVERAYQTCAVAPGTTQESSLAAGAIDPGSACRKLLGAHDNFAEKYNAITTALNRVEMAYRDELAKQERLMAEAQRIQ